MELICAKPASTSEMPTGAMGANPILCGDKAGVNPFAASPLSEMVVIAIIHLSAARDVIVTAASTFGTFLIFSFHGQYVPNS